jgi:hypothetical protein
VLDIFASGSDRCFRGGNVQVDAGVNAPLTKTPHHCFSRIRFCGSCAPNSMRPFTTPLTQRYFLQAPFFAPFFSLTPVATGGNPTQQKCQVPPFFPFYGTNVCIVPQTRRRRWLAHYCRSQRRWGLGDLIIVTKSFIRPVAGRPGPCFPTRQQEYLGWGAMKRETCPDTPWIYSFLQA